jgi:hypothetical protein
MNVTLKMIDWALHGVPVYFHRSVGTGEVYATTHDFSRFIKEPPIEIVRVRITPDTPAGYDCATDPVILNRLKEYNR